jgi:hypothetical protein
MASEVVERLLGIVSREGLRWTRVLSVLEGTVSAFTLRDQVR